MRIITYSCPACGTVVAANELEAERVMKCPGLSCERVLRFENIPEEPREYFLDHKSDYQM